MLFMFEKTERFTYENWIHWNEVCERRVQIVWEYGLYPGGVLKTKRTSKLRLLVLSEPPLGYNAIGVVIHRFKTLFLSNDTIETHTYTYNIWSTMILTWS